MQGNGHFSNDDAKRYYDRFGSKQDHQGFYEDVALDTLVRLGNFPGAQSVLELGCGTGRLAARLLAEFLPSSASYVAIDISNTMVSLAKERLRPWSDRTAVQRTGGDFDFCAYNGPFDRVVSTYVFDLLDQEGIANALAAAHSAVHKGGYLCTAGLTPGTGVLPLITSTLWTLVHDLKPSLVGGCRPLALAGLLPSSQWRILHREVVVGFGIPSEVLVAEAIQGNSAVPIPRVSYVP